MNTPLQFAVVLLLSTAFSGSAQSTTPTSTQTNAKPSVAEITAGYTNFQQITKSVVFVNPELAMLCRGASKEQVDAARVRFGPHANTGILVYMNKLAADAFTTNASAFPVGAVIVKQKKVHGYTTKDGKRVHEADTGVGGMVKRSAGYDPKHGDWEYFYFEDTKKIESGRIASCVQCHSSAKDKDYVFGTWRKIGG
jgi:Cytochrome P460